MSYLLFLIDNSLSTQKYTEQYLETINTILAIQKNKNPDLQLILALFNDKYEILNYRTRLGSFADPNLYNKTPFLSEERFNPRGSTALYDSIASILFKIAKFSGRMEAKNAPICIVLTDGYDTNSKRVDKQLVAKLLYDYKLYGAKFIFLGIDNRSVEIGKEMGFDINIIYDFTQESLKKLVDIISNLVDSFYNKIIENTITDEIDEILDLTSRVQKMNLD